MTSDLIQAALYAGLLLAAAIPLGLYVTRVFTGEATFLAPVERAILAPAGINAEAGQHWTRYALSLVAFNAAGFALLFLLLRFQNLLPLNPQGFDGVPAHLAFNTAISFVTNTNWQSYGGETTLSHFSQMVGLTTQNFVSAASGMAVAAAVARGIAGRQVRVIGNFWSDMVRAVLYVLLPVSIVLALVFVALGMPQTLAASTSATTLEGAQQTLALGPVASQVAISSAPTAAASSTSTRPIHSKIRRRSRTSSRCWRSW
jgi:potassium-transporting ATPase potassium-binding subunit